jgi:hypothetical protein
MGIKNDKVLNKTGTEYLVSKIKTLITQSINGLAAVARTGSYNDLSDKPEHLGHSIKDATATYTNRANLQFEGNVEITDDSTNDATKVKIKGSQSDIFNMVYPVGSIYISVNNANPSTFFGGTWVSWGSGRVPVGVDADDTDFDTVDETGGAKSHSYTPSGSNAAVTLTAAQSGCPQHNHSMKLHTHRIPSLSGTATSNGEHTHELTKIQSYGFGSSGSGFTAKINASYGDNGEFSTNSSGAHAHSVTTVANTTGSPSDNQTDKNAGSNATASHNHTFTGIASIQSHLQPYITCYMWKRTA